MAKTLLIALEEQLEIEKLADLEDQAAKTGSSEILFDNLKKLETANDLKEKADEGSEKTDSSGISGNDSDLSSDQTPTDGSEESDQVQAQDPGTAEEDGLQVAKEELKSLSISVEEYSDYAASGTKGIIDTVGSAFVAAVSALVFFGIAYGPTIVKSMYKGVIYIFGKLAKLLYVSSTTLARYIERRKNSFTNLKESIASLQKSITLLKHNDNDLTGQEYSDQKVINSLKIGQNTDFIKNIGTLKQFLNITVAALSRQISNDIGAINHLLSYRRAGATKLPDNMLTVKPLMPDMVPGTVDGYQNNQEFTESYKYNETLPSDVVLIAVLPRNDLDTLEAYTKAYSESKLFLGINMESFTEIKSVDYMTLDALTSFLTELDKLCDECIAHQTLYERINIAKKHMKFSFKNYFMTLASADTKVSMKDSLVEYIYLKSMFIDKVYLTAAMDIHDYTAKVISFGISFTEDHIKKLS